MSQDDDVNALAVFRLLLTTQRFSQTFARQQLKLSEQELRTALSRLGDLGLIRPEGEVQPVGAEVALVRLMASQLDGIFDWTNKLQALHQTLETLTTAPPSPPNATIRGIEATLLVGSSDIRAALDTAAQTARYEVVSMHPGSPLPEHLLEESLKRNQKALSRGVRMKTIHTEAIQNVPHGAAHLRELQRAGVEVRLAAVLPFRMILVDGILTYLSLPSRKGKIAALEVRGQELCAMTRAIYDYCWTVVATPASGYVPSSEAPLSRRELVILRMFANGMKDEAVARSLGISSRTLRRVSSEIMDKLGAESRFQAGVKAVERGLLQARSHPPN